MFPFHCEVQHFLRLHCIGMDINSCTILNKYDASIMINKYRFTTITSIRDSGRISDLMRTGLEL